MKLKILVVIPSFNCEKQLPRAINQFINSEFNGKSDLLIIDNCSKDLTVEKAIKFLEKYKEKIISNVKLVKNRANIGLGGTHKAAFIYSLKKDYSGVIIFHGDDQGKISDFDFICKNKIREIAILGSRFEKGSKVIGYSNFRVFGNLVFNFIYSLCTKKRITDMGSGLNYFNKELIASKTFIKMPDDLTFNNAYLLNIIKNKSPFKFYPITWSETDQASNAKLVSQSLKIFKLLIKFLVKKNDENIIIQKKRNYNFEIIWRTN